ncbi:MAG TPA: FeoC-like transcriptional regulator [Acidimicrobiia bacterium]|nr:FeoC-like transcriptional regulator [Acidimicrobiia bacterium]
MTILDRLMTEMRDVRGSMSSNELAHRLGVTTFALEGMLDALAARGHLTVDSPGGDGTPTCAGTACTTTCAGFEGCPFVAAVPQPRRFAAKASRLEEEHTQRRRAKNSVRMD